MNVNLNGNSNVSDKLKKISKIELLEYISYFYGVIYDEESCEGKELIDDEMRKKIEELDACFRNVLMNGTEIA